MKRFVVSAWLCLCLHICAQSQSISVGSTISPGLLPPSLRHYWLDGKPAILYFFSSACSASFTSLLSLQQAKQQYGSGVQFLLIPDSDILTSETYRDFANWYKFDFSVVADTAFSRRLPAGPRPAVCWLNASGRVEAITGPFDVTKENLDRLVQGKPVIPRNFQAKEKLAGILAGYEKDSTFLIKSELSEWKENDPIVTLQPDNPSRHFQALGVTLKHLYYYAFTGKIYWAMTDSLYPNFSRDIIVEQDGRQSEYLDWNKLYNYRLVFQQRMDQPSALHKLQEDLNSVMPYTAKLEKRKMPYYKLVILGSDTSRIATKHGAIKGKITQAAIDMVNHPLWPLLYYIHMAHWENAIILDETKLKGNVDIRFNAILSDLSSLKQGLRKAGLDLEQDWRVMNVIVLTRKETNVAAMP